MRHLFTLFLICGWISITLAQEPLKIGQWRSHLPYKKGRFVTQSADKVYYATGLSVLIIDKAERSIDFLSTIDGLSNTSAEIVKYDPSTATLIVGYDNSTFDLVDDSGIVTFTNIRNDGSFFNRTINSIRLLDNGNAYFTTSFGVVEFDMSRREFGFTADLAIDVNDIALYKDFFYAATEEGIYRAPNNPAFNLKDINNWELLDQEEGFPNDYRSRALQVFNGQLYMDLSDALFGYDGQNFQDVFSDRRFRMSFLSAEGEHLLLGQFCNEPNCNGQVLAFDQNGNRSDNGGNCVRFPSYAIETEDGRIWYADLDREYRTGPTINSECELQEFNSPFSELAYDMVIANDVLYVATEPTRAVPKFNSDGVFQFKDGQWSTFNKDLTPVLTEFDMFGFYRLAAHPTENKVYAGTMWKGMAEFNFDNGEIRVFNSDNSNLSVSTADNNVTRITGLAFDSENRLWASNHEALNPIAVYLEEEDRWKSDFQVPTSLPVRQMIIDDFGNKWALIDSKGVLVFNEGDMDDPSDDMSFTITTSNSQLPSNQVRSIALDLDGSIWVGTNTGVVKFDGGGTVDNIISSKPIVEVGGFNAFLLEDENVLSIAIDGANRKWFGTDSGLFIQSPDGTKQVAFFNRDNSPLFDNAVFDIAINDNTGEAYIATGRGLIAFKTDAVAGGVVNSSNAYAYPNPVKPEYDGPIAIKGLARNANVKITDVTGQLVFETTALGGQAIWDGRDYNGTRASSGVYLVFSTSSQQLDNPDAIVTKILLLH